MSNTMLFVMFGDDVTLVDGWDTYNIHHVRWESLANYDFLWLLHI